MYSAARRAAQELNGTIDVVEYKITQAENVVRAKKLGIQHLPCILINGELKFSSIIPSTRELLEEIEKVQHG